MTPIAHPCAIDSNKYSTVSSTSSEPSLLAGYQYIIDKQAQCEWKDPTPLALIICSSKKSERAGKASAIIDAVRTSLQDTVHTFPPELQYIHVGTDSGKNAIRITEDFEFDKYKVVVNERCTNDPQIPWDRVMNSAEYFVTPTGYGLPAPGYDEAIKQMELLDDVLVSYLSYSFDPPKYMKNTVWSVYFNPRRVSASTAS